jgi:hypothetical protein
MVRLGPGHKPVDFTTVQFMLAECGHGAVEVARSPIPVEAIADVPGLIKRAMREWAIKNRQENKHNFAFGDDVCTHCGVSQEKFEDSCKPQCTGKRAPPREPIKFRP